MKNLSSYFDALAVKQRSRGRAHRYYWKTIADYCFYFSQEDQSVLEIGCGTGSLLAAIKGKTKVGIDFSGEMIADARQQNSGITFYHMPAENLQLEGTFDMIILSNLVGYLDDVQVVLAQLHKVCHPRTKIIVTYFNYLWEPALNFSE